MENFDPEMLFPPNEDKIKFRNEIINQSIFSMGIEEKESIVHFGCGSRDKSFTNYIKNKKVEYIGIDLDDVVKECESNPNLSNLKFKSNTIQSFIDDEETNKLEFNWSIIDGIFNKNLYEDSQYEFVDTIIRKLLGISQDGLIIVFNREKTRNDDSYNIDFLIAYIGSMYNRFTVSRLNREEYIICIYKYYY